MCHKAWEKPMHVGKMASHMCDTWHAMCQQHGIFEGYKYGVVLGRGSNKKEKGGNKRERERKETNRGKEKREREGEGEKGKNQ